MNPVLIRMMQAAIAVGMGICFVIISIDLPGTIKWIALFFVSVCICWVLPWLDAQLKIGQ